MFADGTSVFLPDFKESNLYEILSTEPKKIIWVLANKSALIIAKSVYFFRHWNQCEILTKYTYLKVLYEGKYKLVF